MDEPATDNTARADALAIANGLLRASSRCSKAIVQAPGEEALVREICAALADDDRYPVVWYGRPMQDAARSIEIAAASGHGAPVARTLALSWGAGESGNSPPSEALRTGQAQVVDDVARSPGNAAWLDCARRTGTASILAMPVRISGNTEGVLTVQAREKEAFPPLHAEFLGQFAEDLAFGLRSRRAQAALEAGLLERESNAEALRNVLEQTVTAIAATVECRDPYTANHESRVAALAVAIGTELGLDAHRLEGLRLAGMLHDVGKIKVPVEYLTRPGKLSKLEFEVIKVHPEVGRDILAAIPFPWPIADIVWQHHECLDGSGYPRGLRGEEILLESRILTVADIVESMSSARPYRAPLGVDVALEEIASQSGIRYDSAVVSACVRVVREKGFVLGD